MLLNFYYEHKIKFVYTFLLAFLFIFQSFILAQTGTIKGTVTDKATKDALVGANIVVQGTNLGAAADIDGNYVIHNVSAGSHVLVISYVGYKNLTMDVNVTANKTNEINIKLEAEAIEGKTIIVTAQARGQLEAINQQLSSNSIVNVVSTEKMQELPDANIAESIGRLPGISLQRNAGEAYAVVVRGLSPQYNEVTIEGVPMTSTNYYDRGVDLSLLSDNMVKGVEVSKTLRPDMDANALGGTVNLTLKTADPGLHYNIAANGGYNDLKGSYNNYKVAGSVSDRFFNDKIGVLVQGNIEEKQLPSYQFNGTYSSPTFSGSQFYINTNSAQLTDNNTNRRRYGVSLVLDYASDFVDVKLSNLYDIKKDSNITKSWTSSFVSNNFQDDIYINQTTTEQRTHSLQALFKFAGTELPVSLSYTRSDQHTPNGQQFTFLESGVSALQGHSNLLIYGQPSNLIGLMGGMDGTNVNSNFNNMYINNTNLVDQSYDGKLDWKIPFKLSDSFSGKLSAGAKFHYVERVSDNTQVFDYFQFGNGAGHRADIMNYTAYLKALGSSYYNTAYADQSGLPAYPWIDSDHQSNILGFPVGQMFNVYKLADLQNYLYYGIYQNKDISKSNPYYQNGVASYQQDYNDKENSYAGYIMGELNVGSDLIIVPGVRYQEELTDISAYHIVADPTQQNGLHGSPVLVNSKRTNVNWFPSVNIKYKATDNIQVLGAVYESVSLPSYGDISPLVILQTNTNIVSGNPLLKPSTAWNVDLGASWFNNFIGLFSANFFYKDISNLIYAMQNYFPLSTYPIVGAPSDLFDRLPGKSYYDTTWANSNKMTNLQASIPMNDPDHAYLRGLELSWQTHLWYLPGLLSGLVLDINASFMSSSQSYPSFKVISPKTGNKDTLVYTTTQGNLQNQPKATYNVILGWDYKGFSARFSYRDQKTTLTSMDTRFGLQDSYYGDVTLWDISLKQQVLSNCSVYANATNINKHIDSYYYSHPTYVSSNGTTYTSGSLPTSEQTYGWALQLGISYSY